MTLSLNPDAKRQRENLERGYAFVHGVDDKGREYTKRVPYAPSRVTVHTPLGVETKTWAELTPAQRKLQRKKDLQAAQQRQHEAATSLVAAEFRCTTAEFELKMASNDLDAKGMAYWSKELERARIALERLQGVFRKNPRKSAKHVHQTKLDGKHVELFDGKVVRVQTAEEFAADQKARKLAKQIHATKGEYLAVFTAAAQSPEKAAALAPWQEKLLQALQSLQGEQEEHAEAVKASARFHARSKNGAGSGQM